MCQDLISHFCLVKEPRAEKNKLYPLEECLLLCICAVVSGAEGWKDIAVGCGSSETTDFEGETKA